VVGGAAGVTRTPEVRVEIQALRAIAVLLVLVFHVWPTSIRGGFVGVDVFFAISGFLITSHLLREVDRTGRLSLLAFWARRARRLLPAALLVLLVCTILTLVVVPVTYWVQYFDDLRASTAYGQNWRLAAQAVDYFAAGNAPSPVQHYWSLSAEEQFYLVWPVLILAALALARRRVVREPRRSIALVLSAVAALSLACSIYYTAANPAAAYFVTPTRAWEFAAGGLLALLPERGGSHDGLDSVLSWAGISAIALAAFSYSVRTEFPGWAALLPVAGALAVIRAGAPRRRWAPTPVLGLAPVQFVGDVSYSIYLWHWPFLILAPFVLHGGVHTNTRITIVMLTILAAWLTKVCVEDPVRTGRWLTRRPPRWTFAYGFAAMALVAAVTIEGSAQVEAQIRKADRASRAFLATHPRCFGAASRDPQHPCNNPKLKYTVVPTPLAAKGPGPHCREAFHIAEKQVCEFGVAQSKATTTVALIGDSHAGHWRAALDIVGKDEHWYGLNIGHSSCPLSRATRAIPEPERSHCNRWRSEVFKWFRRHPEVSTVFVAQLSGGTSVLPWRGKDQLSTAVAGYVAAWKALPRSVQRIYVIRDTPKARGNTDTCVQQAIGRHAQPGIACALSRGQYLDRDAAAIAAARSHSSRVRLLDFTRFFCDARRCYPVVGGALVFKDTSHMTPVWARTLAPYFERAVDQATGGATTAAASASAFAGIVAAVRQTLRFALI
jgi:peptidoglycan/LPS O-acetylase OafA/YrhL